MPPVRSSSRGIVAPQRHSPAGNNLFRLFTGEGINELPSGKLQIVSGLPDIQFQLNTRKNSSATDFLSRFEEINAAKDKVPCISQESKLLKGLVPETKKTFQKFSFLLNRTVGNLGKKVTTQQIKEYETFAHIAKGILSILSEAQKRKYKLSLTKPIELYHRLEVLIGFVKAIINNPKMSSIVVKSMQKLAHQLCDFRVRSIELIDKLKVIELTIQHEKGTSGPVVDLSNSISNPRPVAANQPNQSKQSDNFGFESGDSDELPDYEDSSEEEDSDIIGPLGRLSLSERPHLVPARRNKQNQSTSSSAGTKNSIELVLEEAQIKGNLPPRFFETTVKFDRKSAREHVNRNEIPVFTADEHDPLSMNFIDFWEVFHDTFHKFTYESFPVVERIFALEKYTDGAAKQAVGVYRTTSHLSGYIECVRDSFMRWGQIGSAIEEIKAQLNSLIPSDYTRNEINKFLASVQACRLKLLTLGENKQDAAYVAAIQIFSKLPANSMVTFRAMYCRERDFRTSARKNPERAYETLRMWLYTNISEIESAGGASSSSINQEMLSNSIFVATNNQKPTTDKPKINGEKSVEKSVELPNSFQETKRESQEPKSNNFPRSEEKDKRQNKHQRNKTCLICDGPHPWFQCPFSRKEKLRHIRLRNRCLNCLGVGHTKNKCKSPRTCRNCKAHGIDKPEEPHHTSICNLEDKINDKKERQVAEKPEDPDREIQPDNIKKTRGEAAMASLVDCGEFTPQQIEAAFKTLGLKGPNSSKT